MMAESLGGKVAAVTGGASGIGLACVKALVAAGVTVFVVDRAEAALAKICADLGPKARPLVVDLLDPASVATMMPAILQQADKLDIFHANAGGYVGGDILGDDPDRWDRMLNLNVNAVFRTIHAVLPHMVERGTGDIIATSSIAGIVPVVAEPVYTASKHAVQAFIHTVRRQVAKYGIRVGAVLPGPVQTALLADWTPSRLAQALAEGAVMPAEEVAEAVIFMLTRPRNVVIRDLVILPHSFDI